ncbi:MAG TPA: protein-export chaperone SecB [Spirochaetota bacterium]|nr:protein-export chaperone SecB [Spirochaetota bacterium]
MDKTQQPGIRIETIILANSTFNRKPVVPETIPVNIEFDVKNTIISQDQKLITEMKATLNKPDDPVYGEFLFVGIFSCSDCKNMSLEQFAENHAPAIIVPYIREEIHSRTMKAGLPHIMINPINIQALLKKK